MLCTCRADELASYINAYTQTHISDIWECIMILLACLCFKDDLLNCCFGFVSCFKPDNSDKSLAIENITL